jgi:hypothetical protein
MSAELYSND